MTDTGSKPASAPCLLDTDDPQINPLWHGSSAGAAISAGNTIIYCAHWPVMVAFYRDCLGLRPTFAKDDWFIELKVCDGCHVSLAAAERCTIPAAAGQGLTLSWQVADLHGWHKQLLHNGAAPAPITSHSWRAPYFYVRDPEGNRIEFWSTGA